MKVCTITLAPRNLQLEVPVGSPLRDFLFEHGTEFPCGGHRGCLRCRVRVVEGDLPVSELDQKLSKEEISSGIRLACQHEAAGDLTLELEQWQSPILADSRPFVFEPKEGLGIAVDLGTTTVAAQLLDRRTGVILAVESQRNQQASRGADVMSRVQHATNGEQHKLQEMVRKQLGEICGRLAKQAPGQELRAICIVGNTVMHNLFSGIDVEPLSRYPFEAGSEALVRFTSAELGWSLPGNPGVSFLPALGSFVGSDILAGMMASCLHESDALQVFVDLGTNGEIVVGNSKRVLCASTAAGPAFEAANISHGMQASTGAINHVELVDGKLKCSILGSGKQARGICGSGLVDAVATMLRAGFILPTGRFADGSQEQPLRDDVKLTQRDVRELQLAKAAVSVGVRILLEEWGARPEDVQRVFVAGAFGNYINLQSALDIGLFRFPIEKIEPVGNTALLGAKMALFHDDLSYEAILEGVEHIGLSDHPRFQDLYVDEMVFPEK